MSSNFEIRRANPGQMISRKFASAAVRGHAVGSHATDPDTAIAATTTNNFLGFLAREVTAAGPLLADHVYPGRLELVDKAGNEVSIDPPPLEVDLEGSDYLTASGSTGGLHTGIAPGTELAFASGKVRVKQSGDVSRYILDAQLTPETAGNVRIRMVLIG